MKKNFDDLAERTPFAIPNNIKLGITKIKSLPLPDKLDCNLNKNHICLITDDGSELTI